MTDAQLGGLVVEVLTTTDPSAQIGGVATEVFGVLSPPSALVYTMYAEVMGVPSPATALEWGMWVEVMGGTAAVAEGYKNLHGTLVKIKYPDGTWRNMKRFGT